MGRQKKILYLLFLLIQFATSLVVKRDEKLCKIKQKNPPKECSWNYLAYFPRIFRSGVSENIMISVHGYPKPVYVNVSLLYVDNKDKIYTSVSKLVSPEELTTIPVLVAHDAPSRLKLRIQGLGEMIDGDSWLFQNTSDSFSVQRLGLNLFVQTDRPIYKPGQTIKCRVIVVDTDLKPFVGKLDKVVIENPSGSRMRQWNDVQIEDGFASFELKTSEKPVLGDWKIIASLKTYKKQLKITLKKFVLPKFQVTIKPPVFISKVTDDIEAEICAKYSYGKSVIGKLRATVCKEYKYQYNWYRRKSELRKPKCVSITRKISGCTTLSLSRTQLGRHGKAEVEYSDQRISFTANVKEDATGVFINASKVERDVVNNEISLSFEKKDVFKPGFPLSLKVHAKYPDGTPADNIKVTIKAGIEYGSDSLFKGDVIVRNGMHMIQMSKVPFHAKKVRVNAKYTRKALTPTEKLYYREATSYHSMTPWYSPSHSYISIEKPKGSAKAGESVDVTVHYTSVDEKDVDRKIYYSLMCGGNIADSGSFMKTFTAAIPENPTQAPTTTTTTATTTKKPIFLSGGASGDPGTPPASPTPRLEVDLYPYWYGGPTATRPPKPYAFSSGSFRFSFDVTKKMMPSCRMVVYYMRDEEVVADDTKFDIIDEFDNKVSMMFETAEVRPGASLKLKLQAAPNSKIAVTAVDKSIHFLAKGNDIKSEDLQKVRENLDISPGYSRNHGRCPSRWGKRKRRSIWPGYGGDDYADSEKAFNENGLKFMSSFHIDARPCSTPRPFLAESLAVGSSGGGAAPKKAKKKPVRARTEFPETWLWLDEKVSAEGTKEIYVTVPDTITSWYASGFAVSQSAGLGVANPTNLRVFQPFFISLNLPYSVVRGEDVTIPAAVFSYLENACITVRITLEYSKNYQMIAGPTAKACICEGRTATVLFRIKPETLGRIPIRIKAETLTENACSKNRKVDSSVSSADVLIRKLLVEPEGVKNSYTISNFLCPKESPMSEFKLRLPKNLVPGSIYSKVTAIGDIMGSSLSNIDELLAMPYGCGEQNMLKFAPNIFIMNYLNNTNQVTKVIEDKALGYMRSGYQRELTYKHDDGSYSAFGNNDVEGSTWLTAFVLKSYAEARPWIEIDDAEIKAPSKWLFKIQSKDGCFPTVGSLHNKAMKGGVKTPATLTAYVLIALLEADVPSSDPRVTKASKCVKDALDDVKDSYSLAIISYMFAKMGNKMYYDKIMQRLNDMAVNEDGMVHWEETKEKKEKENNIYWYYQARSTDIEQTSYALLAILEQSKKQSTSQAVPIIRWLSKQRNGLGGWSSTQDTVLAMQSLAEFAENTYGSALNMRIDVSAGSSFKHTFDITKDNNLVLQQVEDIPVPSVIKVAASGDGCALIQANVRYNIKKVESKPSFEVTYNLRHIKGALTSLKTCLSQYISVCVKWLPKGESNMAIVDVAMVSGFVADEDALEKAIANTPGMKDIETKGKSIIFYFNRFGNNMKCFEFRVDQTAVVRDHKEVPITVYDYYDTEKATTVMYGFDRTQCVGGRLP